MADGRVVLMAVEMAVLMDYEKVGGMADRMVTLKVGWWGDLKAYEQAGSSVALSVAHLVA